MHLILPICRAPWLVPLVSRGTPQIIRTAVSPINYGEEAQVLDSSSARKFAMRREIIAETCWIFMPVRNWTSVFFHAGLSRIETRVCCAVRLADWKKRTDFKGFVWVCRNSLLINTLTTARIFNEISFRPRVPLYQAYSARYSHRYFR